MVVSRCIKLSRLLLPFSLCTLICSCGLCYDPSITGDAPSSPGTEPHHWFSYLDPAEVPYSEEDLSKTMSLSKLLEIALYNNPSTRASWHAARSAAFGFRASLSEYYPSLALTGSLQTQISNGATSISGAGGAIFGGGGSSSSTSGTTTTTSPTVTVNTVFNELILYYLLLDFGGRDAQAMLAYQVLVQADWQHNLVMQEVILSVLTAYTTYIGNKALVIASEQNLKDAEVALRATVVQRNAGLATLTDILSAQSTYEQMRLNLEQAKGGEKTYLAELLIALGLPACTCLNVEDLPDKLPVIEIDSDVCKLIELAKEKKPDIGAAIAIVKQLQAEKTISFSAGMPIVSLNGNASRVNFLKPHRPSIFNDSVSLQWDSPIFSGFFYVNQQKQYQAQIDEALANLDVTVAQVVSGVVTNYYAFITAQASLPSSVALLESSQRAYSGLLSQYRVGTSSIVDVLSFLTILSNARAQLISVKTQWAAALANLAFSVGVLEENSGTWMDGPPKNLYQLQYNIGAKHD